MPPSTTTTTGRACARPCRGAFLFRAQRIDPLRGAFLEIPGGVGADDEDAESGGFADRIKRMLSERPPDEFPPLPQSPPMQMPHYQSRRKTRRRQREEGRGGGGGGNDNGGDSSSGGEGTSASPKREWWGGASLGDELPTPREMCGRLEAEWLAGFPVPAPLPRSSSRCKGQKRKLEDEASAAAAASSLGSAGADDDNEEEDGSAGTPEICCRHSHAALAREVRVQVDVLVRCASSWRHADRAAAKRATHVVAELAKNGNHPSPNLTPAAPIRATASLPSGSGGCQLSRGGCQRDCRGRRRGGLGVPPRRACCGGANAGGTTTAAV